MVDFQERDTRRGLREDSDGDRERTSDDEPTSNDERTGSDEGAVTDGEAEIDEVRQRLEERPEPNGEADDADVDGADAHEREDHERSGERSDDAESGHDEHDERNDDHHGHDHHGQGHDHHHGHDLDAFGAAVVTISSTRTLADDPSGDYVVEVLVEEGHDVVTRELIPDEYDDVQHTVDSLVRRGDVDVVVTTGGTGVTPDDRTVEAVRPLFEKELPGFGELFRRLSYEEIASRVVATRATAGIIDGVAVFCLPGSTDAVRLAIEEIIVEEAPHLAGLAQRDDEA